MAEMDSIRACRHCGAHFEEVTARRGRRQIYCGKSCNRAAQNAKHPEWASRRNRHRPDRVRRPSEFVCAGCGHSVSRVVRGAKDAGRYCSRGCYEAKRSALAAEKAALVRIGQAWAWRPSALVVQETDALRRIARYVERPVRTRRQCNGCGCEVVSRRTNGRPQSVCAECQRQRVRLAAAAAKRTPSGRAAKHRHRAIRRMRMGVAAEAIDPFAVFTRDKWTCQLCGVKTPRKLRGTYEPNAPELDHVIPLAQGGSHAWANVQCACRKCNGAKGARAIGQLGLPLVA